jgi:hypothetical protein
MRGRGREKRERVTESRMRKTSRLRTQYWIMELRGRDERRSKSGDEDPSRPGEVGWGLLDICVSKPALVVTYLGKGWRDRGVSSMVLSPAGHGQATDDPSLKTR